MQNKFIKPDAHNSYSLRLERLKREIKTKILFDYVPIPDDDVIM